ncbi:hypothetical protein ACFPM0_36745 [Pseudonocardia sulfidoxydans]|uniref:hypothetical protein n=1 Tax=Pseudonocardia sulfidoxydans TaxID=54011 RepID=UPI0036126786
MRLRRFICVHSSCPRKTFAELFPQLAGRYRRSTHALQTMLRSLGLSSVALPRPACPAGWACPPRG